MSDAFFKKTVAGQTPVFTHNAKNCIVEFGNSGVDTTSLCEISQEVAKNSSAYKLELLCGVAKQVSTTGKCKRLMLLLGASYYTSFKSLRRKQAL